MAHKKPESSAIIDSVKHKDKRTNIPEELRDFIKEDEKSPKTIFYPRDTTLDPQRVLKGKDEQDSKDLAVPVVPIYIQEKIHPQAIVKDIKAYAARENAEQRLNLFGDFNGIKFEDMNEFYQHEQNWSNRMTLGDSLQVSLTYPCIKGCGNCLSNLLNCDKRNTLSTLSPWLSRKTKSKKSVPLGRLRCRRFARPFHSMSWLSFRGLILRKSRMS